jgi:hypothetical protein
LIAANQIQFELSELYVRFKLVDHGLVGNNFIVGYGIMIHAVLETETSTYGIVVMVFCDKKLNGAFGYCFGDIHSTCYWQNLVL